MDLQDKEPQRFQNLKTKRKEFFWSLEIELTMLMLDSGLLTSKFWETTFPLFKVI